MEDQYFGRYQKPKGSNIKQVLKLMLVLVFSVWFLYQIKQTETKNYGGQTKVVAGSDGAKLLGRKGMPTRLVERSLPGSRKVGSVGEGSGMDQVSDGALDAAVIMEEIDEVQSYHDENGVPPDSNEDTEIKEEENKMQKNVVASAANAGVIMEEPDEVQSFRDENGVPPESNEENISTFSKVNWLKKINVYDVTHGEENDVEMNLEGSTNATQDSKEINMGSTSFVDTSGSQSRNRWR